MTLITLEFDCWTHKHVYCIRMYMPSIYAKSMLLIDLWIVRLNYLSRPGIVTLVPIEKEIPCRCEQEDQAVKETWKGRGGAQPNEHVI